MKKEPSPSPSNFGLLSLSTISHSLSHSHTLSSFLLPQSISPSIHSLSSSLLSSLHHLISPLLSPLNQASSQSSLSSPLSSKISHLLGARIPLLNRIKLLLNRIASSHSGSKLQAFSSSFLVLLTSILNFCYCFVMDSILSCFEIDFRAMLG